ncbi:MAG: alpha-galactosidase [Oscillospiraceae bacterium]|nr:alpha-galactosidase [Oscillospiraceae bacterium]
MIFDYTIRYYRGHGPEEIKCSVELRPGANVIAPELPKGKLWSVKGTLRRSGSDRERIFINGYQTWTYCPEHGRWDKIRSFKPLPKTLVRHFGLDRYGDYYFVDYPESAGFTHGESWCYFRKGAHYELFASLDERPGYTLFEYDAHRGLLTVERDCRGVLHGGGAFHAFDLFLAAGAEDEVFDAWFRALGVKPRTTEKLTGYSSWYNRYQKISEKTILEDLEGCAKVLRPGDLFQIDDGFETAVGDWLDPDLKKFPNGLKPIVERIHEKGLKAGLWLAPFVAQKSSLILRDHPDWLLRHEGEPWRCGSNWGGFWSLDIDHPRVREYLQKVFRRVFDDWGFDMVKLDFLYAGAPFGNERESRAGRMMRAMEWLRELCGDKLILGCGVPLMPAFGLVDYCRISCDVGLDWNDRPIMQDVNRERVSTRQAIGNTVFRRQLNGRAWLNDPDVFFLRDDNLKLSGREKQILATVNSLFGGLLLCSDNMGRYTPEAEAAYRQLLRNRDAEDIRVLAEGKGLSVRYRLDGKEHFLRIE